jgi:hypothetical protein
MGNLVINWATLYRRFRFKPRVAFRQFVKSFSLLAHTGHARTWYHVSSQRISWMARSGSGASPTTTSHIRLLKNWMRYPFVSLPFMNGNFIALRLAVFNTCVPWGPQGQNRFVLSPSKYASSSAAAATTAALSLSSSKSPPRYVFVHVTSVLRSSR